MELDIEKVKTFFPKSDILVMKQPLITRISRADERISHLAHNGIRRKYMGAWHVENAYPEIKEIADAVRPYRNLLNLINYLESTLYSDIQTAIEETHQHEDPLYPIDPTFTEA